MRKILTLLTLTIFLISLTSAEIIINQQPNEIYNLGDSISVPLIIRASTDITGSLNLDLVCSGKSVNFYKNGISLGYGEDLELNPAPALVLTKDIIGTSKGNCKIKVMLTGEEQILTEEFKISNLINIYIEERQVEFKPGEQLLVEGTATKENGIDADGFIELTMVADNSTESLTQLGIINNGFFSINITLPQDMEAKFYLTQLKAYENNLIGEETNIGSTNYNILITQVPTSLEIIFDNQDVEPGTNVMVKAILHDQTGHKIEGTTSIITIKNPQDKIMGQLEIANNEYLEFLIEYNKEPALWSAVAVSSKLTTESTFNVIEKKEVDILLINKTIEITNIGNVPYCNETLLVKIGENLLNIDICLEINEKVKYLLTAPDGEYQIEVISEGGSILSENAMLTGRSIDIKEKVSLLSSSRSYVIWVFLIAILGFIAFIMFKKGYKRSFFGKAHLKKKGKSNSEKEKIVWTKVSPIPLRKKSLINAKNKAELSLTLKGEKHNASIICLKIKNLHDLEAKKGNAEQTLQKIIDLAESKKAMIYENQSNIFLIFAPLITKTFHNESVAVNLARKINNLLDHHNKLFKQKIEFGLGINYGEIIAKIEKDKLKFMSVKDLIITSKRLCKISNKEVLLSDKFKAVLGSEVKTSKHTHENIVFHKIKEIIDKEKHKKFISGFLQRMEKEKNSKK